MFTNESGVAGVREALGELRQPDVVVWNTGLWLGGLAEKELRKEFRAFFEAADEMWPGNATRVVVRSTTSVVQPVTCFEAGGHGRERSARMGGWMKEEVEAWGKRGRRVGWVDAFALTDSRPETTLDGFHWVSEEGRAVKKGWVGWDREARPLVGEAEVGGMDWVWDEVLRLE